MANARNPASSIASATSSTAVPGTSTTAPAEEGGTGRRRTRKGSGQRVSRYEKSGSSHGLTY